MSSSRSPDPKKVHADNLGDAKTPPSRDNGRTWGESLNVRLRWMRGRLTGGLRSLGRNIDHPEVVSEVDAEGKLSGRYVFMTIMSCAIAMLGMLLSSPAVVIGAMLISPLMGPIMLLGFSLCVLDYEEMRRALGTLIVGVVAALVIAIIIVLFSPLREATPEILARTRPNLFDLLVAIFSGLAGGYSVIHRKGATIVGVAIATALMPPLAVVGFGIATGNAVIAGGAFGLFMTNLLAIALSVTGLAWLHGFATVDSRSSAPFQTVLVLSVFAALSVPLGLSLRDIANEARVQNLVREEALHPFNKSEAMVASLTVNFPRNKPVEIQQTVYTKNLVPGAEEQLNEHYQRVLGVPVEVQLNQVAVDQDKPIDEATVEQMARSSIAPLQQVIAQMEDQDRTRTAIRAALPIKTTAVDINPDEQTVSIVAAPTNGLPISTYAQMEQTLQERFVDWRITLMPPVRDLPLVGFETGGATVSNEGERELDRIKWALQRWGVSRVEVVGQSSMTSGGSRAGNMRLALRRAQAVADDLTADGVQASAKSGFGVDRQAELERELGQLRFQTAKVIPVFEDVQVDATAEPTAIAVVPSEVTAEQSTNADVANATEQNTVDVESEN